MSFRDEMIVAMKARKMSMAELARRAEVSYDVVRDLVRRKESSTSAERAARISRVLGLDGADDNDLAELVAIFNQMTETERKLLLGSARGMSAENLSK